MSGGGTLGIQVSPAECPACAYNMREDDGVPHTHSYSHMPRGSPIHTEALSTVRPHPSSPIPYVAAAECREGVELAAVAEWRTSLPSSTESRRGEASPTYYRPCCARTRTRTRTRTRLRPPPSIPPIRRPVTGSAIVR